ncbi:classical arabinogalactan protein 9-like [Brachypodium distachyon]|uniref:classical arabinogalactan protein 9-like n=1 Tax=Brachypodium distachyon TaxID=15368 RepID=UPI000D0C9CF5|nr:classical arabinogalactan protein 9-like [Brachypodium distachyon]|eukprot:XP_024312086.1 classical arabinogalactan protein 9-like [Brachypodium distachyon]
MANALEFCPPPAWTLAPPPAWTTAPRPHTGSPGLLGSRPPAHAFHAYTNGAPYQSPYPMQPTPYLMQPLPYQYQQAATPPDVPATTTVPLYQAAAAPGASTTTSTSTPAPNWDQGAFIAAMTNFAAQGEGFSNQEGDRQIQLLW